MFPRLLLVLLLFAPTAHADYESVDPETSPFRLAGVVFGDVPVAAWNYTSVQWGMTFVCDFAAWEGDVYLVEAEFCYTNDDEAGWKEPSISEFLDSYVRLEDVRQHTVAPKIATSVGNATVIRFSLDPGVESGYQCAGLIKAYNRNRSQYFHKGIDLYVCNDGPWALTDESLHEVLRGLSLDGEFSSLVP